jgi:hypothetical protein
MEYLTSHEALQRSIPQKVARDKLLAALANSRHSALLLRYQHRETNLPEEKHANQLIFTLSKPQGIELAVTHHLDDDSYVVTIRVLRTDSHSAKVGSLNVISYIEGLLDGMASGVEIKSEE